MRHLLSMTTLALGTALAVPAAAQDAPGTCGDLSIAQMGWTSAEIITEVAKFLLEQGYGCDVTLVKSDTIPAITSVADLKGKRVGTVVGSDYDPMLGKVIAWGKDREAARVRLYERVPWLDAALIAAVQTYAGDIRIDTDAIEEKLRDIDPQDAEAVAEAAKSLPLELGTDPIVETVMCNGVDIREAIRSERVTAAVSAVASNPEARKALIAQQRLEIVSNGKRIVAEGRDITTVVAPDATVRILLTASEEVRKARRGEQLGGDRTSEQLEADVSRRDAADSRVNNFTEAAEGVDLVDSTDLDFEQTVAEVIRVIDETAARMILETVRRLAADGHEVWFAGLDDAPLTHGRLDDEGFDLGRGVHVRMGSDLDDVAEQIMRA